MTTVMNIRDLRHQRSGRLPSSLVQDEDAVYIGRANRRYALPKSMWANPFAIGRDGARDEVIAKYRAWLLDHPLLLQRLRELEGKTLICWCKPAACHGDVIAELVEALPGRGP